MKELRRRVVWRWCWANGNRKRQWFPRGVCSWWVLYKNKRFLLTRHSDGGIRVSGRTARTAGSTLRDPDAVLWEYASMAIKKRKKEATDAQHLAGVESEVFKELLPLVEHCSVRKYDDATPRETGWFTVKTQGAAWVVQVKDPDTCSSFAAVADTLDGALSTAALMLASEEAPWELDKFLQAMKAQKKSK